MSKPKATCRFCSKQFVNVELHITKAHAAFEVMPTLIINTPKCENEWRSAKVYRNGELVATWDSGYYADDADNCWSQMTMADATAPKCLYIKQFYNRKDGKTTYKNPVFYWGRTGRGEHANWECHPEKVAFDTYTIKAAPVLRADAPAWEPPKKKFVFTKK